MNVLLLTQFYSTTKGGGEYVFKIIAKKLAENGNHVWVITNKIIGEDYENYDDISLVLVKPELEYKGGLPPSFLDNLRYTINAIKEGNKIINEKKIDVIHSNNFSPSLAGSILSFFTSKPHIIAIHDIFSLCGKNYWGDWAAQNQVSKINSFLAPIFEKLMIKLKHDCVHTVSEATRDDLLEFGEKKPIHVIHNSIDKFQTVIIDTISSQFVYVGRLVFYKNLEVVFRAIDIIRKKKPEIKLIVIGGGPHQKKLENMVKKLELESNILFKGYTDSDEKTKLIAQSNGLILPSLCEGFGLVILEAFSQKKPVLVSNLRPMSDIVSDGNTGFVLDPYDEKVWVEHILKLVNEPNLAKILGNNGFKTLNANYNQDLMYQKLIKMYNDVLTKN